MTILNWKVVEVESKVCDLDEFSKVKERIDSAEDGNVKVKECF